jgi:hypothetical protein
MKRAIHYSIIISAFFFGGCQSKTLQNRPTEVFTYNPSAAGREISIEFTRGKEFNHPLLAIWVEDEKGTFIQTLYVSESVGKGVFQHGIATGGKWMPGEVRRPAALPVWSHRRGIKASDGLFIPDKNNPVADAYSGPTPKGNFILKSNLDSYKLPRFTIYLEINQSWDWNEYWTNDRYPNDEDYKTSCQPALVYKIDIDSESAQKEYVMKVAGHSHYSGKTGGIFPDLSTLTTSLDIVKSIMVRIK